MPVLVDELPETDKFFAPRKSGPLQQRMADNETKGDENEGERDLYTERLPAVLPFAHPLASRKLNKRVLKTVRRASRVKHVKRGVKEVVKALRKGERGLVVLAGDISPGDVIAHLPVLCEDAGVTYVFVPSKEDLGMAGHTKRPTSCVLIVPGPGADDYRSLYDEVVQSLSN